jgi:hypothetical protein
LLAKYLNSRAIMIVVLLPILTLERSTAIKRALKWQLFAFFGEMSLKLFITHLALSFLTPIGWAPFEYRLIKEFSKYSVERRCCYGLFA